MLTGLGFRVIYIQMDPMDEADATHRSPSRLISFRAVISVLDGHP
jgi:hypothetical protein